MATEVTIYDENVEWTFSTLAASLNPADNSNPHTGLIDLQATNALGGDQGKWTAPSPLSSSPFQSLSLWLEVSGIWSALTSAVSLSWLDPGGNPIGVAVAVKDGVYGFSIANLNYQNVVIPLSDFGISNVSLAALVLVVNTKTHLSFFLDTIHLISAPNAPVATDPQSLLNAANCYNCNTPGEWQLMRLALLRQILLASNPMAATDPQSLLNQAACYNCYLSQWALLELSLLSQIATASGGALCITGGTGAPTAAVPCQFALYVQQPGPNFGLWLGDLNSGWSNVIMQGP
jgi:hypothetical protein